MKTMVLDLLRPWVRRTRSLRDRSLHPMRRKKAEGVMRSLSDPGEILVLCTGNICRSPYAEKVLLRMVSDGGSNKVRVTSGGFLRSDRPSPEAAVRVAGARAVSLGEHRSRQITDEDLVDCDLVVVMEVKHERKILKMNSGRKVPVVLLGDLDPELPSRREIEDPWGKGDEVFNSSFDRVDRCLYILHRLIKPLGSDVL